MLTCNRTVKLLQWFVLYLLMSCSPKPQLLRRLLRCLRRGEALRICKPNSDCS